MKDKILAISGKPGLYRLVSRGKNSLIVEVLDGTRKRMPVFSSASASSLNDICMYTNTDDVPLEDVLASLHRLEGGKEVGIDFKKCTSGELREHFAKVLPDFDGKRVHDSDIRKLFQWYNILVRNGITDFGKDAPGAEGEAGGKPRDDAKE